MTTAFLNYLSDLDILVLSFLLTCLILIKKAKSVSKRIGIRSKMPVFDSLPIVKADRFFQNSGRTSNLSPARPRVISEKHAKSAHFSAKKLFASRTEIFGKTKKLISRAMLYFAPYKSYSSSKIISQLPKNNYKALNVKSSPDFFESLSRTPHLSFLNIMYP